MIPYSCTLILHIYKILVELMKAISVEIGISPFGIFIKIKGEQLMATILHLFEKICLMVGTGGREVLVPKILEKYHDNEININ